jgi:hypothetical protein
LGVIFMERCFRECYADDSLTTTCSGVLGQRNALKAIIIRVIIKLISRLLLSLLFML